MLCQGLAQVVLRRPRKARVVSAEISRVIPIEIGGVLFIRICAEQPEGERRLADLSRTADQDHFLVEGPSDRTRRVKILERQPGQQDPRTRGPVESTLPVG